MRKILLVTAAALMLTACDDPDQVGTANSGNVSLKEICIDGVVYLYRSVPYKRYMSVKFNPDSTVVTCK